MVYYHRWHDLGADCPCVVYALRNHKGESKVTYDYTIKTETEDMAKCGFPVVSRPLEWESYYCPHVSTQDYASGWYDKVDKLQGQKNTYFAGEVLCFGDMEDHIGVRMALKAKIKGNLGAREHQFPIGD